MIRRVRLVRLHLKGDAPSIEGLWKGQHAGHYRLEVPRVLAQVGSSEDLDGIDVLVPRENVLFVQRLQ